MNARTGIGLGLLLVCAAVLFWPTKKLTPEDEVRALVSRAVRAAEKRDVGAVGSALSDDFKGQGGVSKTDLKQLLMGQFLRTKEGLLVVNPSLEVTVDSPQTAHFAGRFVFATGSGTSGIDGTQYEIDATVEKTDDGWRISQATWHSL